MITSEPPDWLLSILTKQATIHGNIMHVWMEKMQPEEKKVKWWRWLLERSFSMIREIYFVKRKEKMLLILIRVPLLDKKLNLILENLLPKVELVLMLLRSLVQSHLSLDIPKMV